MYHNLFIHSPGVGHLGCIWLWPTMNKASMNIHAQVFEQRYIFIILEKTPKSRVPESFKKGIFNFIRNCQTVF